MGPRSSYESIGIVRGTSEKNKGDRGICCEVRLRCVWRDVFSGTSSPALAR